MFSSFSQVLCPPILYFVHFHMHSLIRNILASLSNVEITEIYFAEFGEE
jgi:hypothetical protein